MQIPKGLHLTGRIRNFLKNPQGRLPVSCTVFVVEDTYLGKDGIAESLVFTSYALRYGAGVAVHLSKVTHFEKYPRFPLYLYIDPGHPDAEEFYATVPCGDSQPPADAVWVTIADSMEYNEAADVSIEQSWVRLFNHKSDRPLVLDFSKIRPKGTNNQRGLVASGPASFAAISWAIYQFLVEPSLHRLLALYSKLNEVLRRGGLYKNGAVVLHLDDTHPLVATFICTPREVTPWARLALCVDSKFNHSPLADLVIPYVRSGDLFLTKRQYYNGERLYHNVCLEILLRSRATCLLAHVNLGVLRPCEIPQAFADGMNWLCDFHARTGVGKDGHYLPPEKDRQVGLGVLGLANLLAIEGITYQEFAQALRREVDFMAAKAFPLSRTPAEALASYLRQGFERAAKVARSYGMERAFTVAPTASCSYEGRDRLGYVTTPEIAPPISTSVVRVSETNEEIEVDYHPDCETAEEVGWETYYTLVCAWQDLMDLTGLGHSISANWWSDMVTMDKQFLTRWLHSPWKSLYYAQPVRGNIQDKSEVLFCDLDCVSCAE